MRFRPFLILSIAAYLAGVCFNFATEETNTVSTTTITRAISPEKPDPFTENYRAALIAYHEGDWSAAKTSAEAAAKIKPDNVKLKLLLGRIATEQKDFAFGEKEIKEALAIDPTVEYGYEYLGDLYFREKNDLAARDAYLKFLDQKPKNPDGVLKLVYSEIGRGDFVAASSDVLQLDPYNETHPGFYFAKAALARSSNRPDEAQKDLEMARTMYGNATWAEHIKTYMLLFPPQKK